MSKILLEKINNILDINKNKEYIDITKQDEHFFINLTKYLSNDQINELFEKNEIEIIFNENYEQILEQAKNINDVEELNEFLIQNNLDGIDLNFLNNNICVSDDIKPKSKKKTKNDENIKKQKGEESKNKSKKKTKIDIEQTEKFKKTDEEIQNELNLKSELFLYHKKELIETIKNYLLNNLKIFKELNSASKKAFVSTGKELLRIGYDFIVGHLNNHYINAALFLVDVELIIIENKLTIKIKPERIINEKLLIFILKELKINYTEWDFSEIKSVQNFIEKLSPIILYDIEQNIEDNEWVENQNSLRKLKNVSKFYLGLFDVLPGKIKQDFIELMNNDTQLFDQQMKNDFEYYTKQEFEQDPLIQINRPLNIYQKYALRSAIEENTLIYGPPGTGKSEIISSIIANLMIRDKTILIVSEKDAALDVIKKRLSKLSNFAFYLKDIENENIIYDQINWISQYMGSFNQLNDDKFDLYQNYKNNDRIKDYNYSIQKFKNILIEDINFSLEKDSRNNDYRDYLLSKKEVNRFIGINKEQILEFWNEYKNKYVKLQSPTDFIAKVAQLNSFKEFYELNEEEINKFETIKIDLNRFIADNNIIDKKIIEYTTLKNSVDQLKEFLNQQLLSKDKDFVTNLKNNHFILKNNYDLWKQIDDILSPFDNKETIQRFLISKFPKHEKFLNKILNISKQEYKINAVNRYFYKGEISDKKMLFKPKKDEKFYDAFINVVQIFTKIKIFKNNNYLFNLIKINDLIINPLVVYFYINDQFLKKSFIEYYIQEMINFDDRILKQYFKYRINQIERELVNINVYNFEKVLKNKHIIERDIPYLINNYLNNNKDFILNLDSALAQIYIKNIKNKLMSCSNELKQKINKMFRIVNFDNRPKINDFIIEFIDCLKIIFPVWISKPELISFYLENKPKLFDVGIFDEASQMFLEKAYPMLYRVEQYIISGDDKQLKPEKLLFNQSDFDPDYKPLVKEIEFDYSESLLDRARVSYWNTYTLINHYRSEAKELIEFSNLYFYDDKLLFSTMNNLKINPLEINNITKAIEENEINISEIKALYKTLKTEINNFTKTLVICFSKNQKDYLIDLIKKEGNLDLQTRIKQSKLVIGDINSVQGDEADLVLISVVYAPNSINYGLVCSLRGQNYLNVAITRSKTKLIIFKSISQKDIKINTNDLNDDILVFKKWIEYLDQKQNESKNKNSILRFEQINSNFKNNVFETLKQSLSKRFKIDKNINIGSIKIDLAIYLKSINDINLIIILDDWKKNIDLQSWFEDIDLQEYLISRNYKVFRIREQDWLNNEENIIKNIASILKNKKNNLKEV